VNHIGKLFRFVKPYWKLAVLALVLLTSLVIMDLSIPRLIQRIIDQGIKQHSMSVVLRTAALMLGISVVSAVVAIGNNIFSIRVGEGVARDLREAIFVKIQSFAYGNMDRFTTGRLMVRLTSDAGAVQRVFQVSLRIGTRGPLLMIGSVILMFRTNRGLALSLVPLLLFALTLIVVFSVKMEPLFRGVQLKLDRLNTVLQENISGARLVKAFVRADHEEQRFEQANEDFAQRNIDVMQFMSTMGPTLTILVNMGIVAVIYAGGLRAIEGSMSLGQIVAFTNYLLTTMSPLLMLTNLSNTWANGIASARRINEVLDTVPDVLDDARATALPDTVRARVVFKDVGFRYGSLDDGDPSNDSLVLQDIDLTAEPGQTVAILGATGAGKSTLVNLIPRFYDPCSGQVTLDGTDIRGIQQDSLLAHVSIVPQETILFSGTVRDNIRYGYPEATDDAVVAAAQAAQAQEFILQLPQGYDTHVEERGVNLSGGQKQRIAIARALLMRPQILILDDSTSSVDVETETRIQDALREVTRDCTSFVVAQRISTVLRADKIVVIDKGRVVAQGTHRELMQSSPIYREIYDSQLGSAPPVVGTQPVVAGPVVAGPVVTGGEND
jgi:ATP-binding cassette subfamily B multidrug efflux pump